MNKGAKLEAKSHLERYYCRRLIEPLTVLDIGSYNVNGSLRGIFPDAWKYTGLDIVPGPNVDIVMDRDKPFPIPPGTVDLVVTVSCFQYVENPFKLIGQLYECLKPGGMIFICASSDERTGLLGLPKHLCPHNDKEFDCWRIKKYGMIALLEDPGFDPVRAYYEDSHCWGIGRK